MMRVADRARIWAIVPAAGMGRRMGRPKQALTYRGSTLAGGVVRTLLDAGAEGVVVVTRTGLIERLDLPEDPAVHVAHNDDSDSEMIDSIRIGLRRLADVARGQAARRCETDGVLVVPADMPGLSAGPCRRCIEVYREMGSAGGAPPIVIAAYGAPDDAGGVRPGHPIVFPFAMRDEVARLRGGLRMLPRRHPERVVRVTFDDPQVVRDVDTPDDYRRLLDGPPKPPADAD